MLVGFDVPFLQEEALLWIMDLYFFHKWQFKIKFP